MNDFAKSIEMREKLIGAAFVAAAILFNHVWMGPAVILLSLGLVVSYALWAFLRWTEVSRSALPIYFLGIVLLCVHSAEEFFAGFHREFPRRFGYQWSDVTFVGFNVAWISLFLLAGLGAYRGVRLAYLLVLFFALGAGILNGLGHLGATLAQGRYFPGTFTAPLLLLVGLVLLARLFRSPSPGM